ncbi:MAG: hypothetical protein M9952_09760 [Microthrixaceae bacterium]|nr:hypothetical protein [Microthrixaceae bacterium]
MYNAFGDTDTVIDATNVWNTATYDQAGRQLSATHAGTGGAATPLMTTFSYDKRGLRTSTVTPEGVQTAVGWDAAGRMSAVTVGTGAAAATTSLFYDPAGNNTRVRNGRGYDTVLDYQSWNLLEARIEPETSSGQPAVDRTWGYRYDPAGLVVSQTQPGSVALNRTFDEAGRTLTETGVGATGSRTFAYDTEGRINSISHPATAVSVTYDDRGLPTTVTGGAGTATFDWDARGQLVTRTDSTGTAVYTYDDAARLLTETDPLTGGQIEYGYDNAGRRVYQANYDSTLAPWPDTPTRWTGHDTYGRVEWDVFVPDSNGNPETYARSYGFDGDNNLHTLNVWGTSNPADTGFQWFNYDTLGQLAEAWTSGTPTYYTYDKAGNRTSAGGVSYTYDPQNRLTSGGGATNTWSDRGTLDAVTTTSGTTTSTFDVFNQNLTNGTVTLTYDGLGRIATRNSTAFTYTGLTLDPTTDGTWTFNHRPDGTVVSLEQNGGINPRWAVLDARNNLVALRDPNTGHVDNTTDYTPYGEPRATTGTLTPTIGYQSDYTDPTTNEVWMGARHYQPTTANFTSRDTHNGRLEQPISLNRYTYAHNNPLTNWDPNGHAPKQEDFDRFDSYLRKVDAANYQNTAAGRAAYERDIRQQTDAYLAGEYLRIYAVFGHLGNEAVNELAKYHAASVTTPVITRRLDLINFAWAKAHPQTSTRNVPTRNPDSNQRDQTPTNTVKCLDWITLYGSCVPANGPVAKPKTYGEIYRHSWNLFEGGTADAKAQESRIKSNPNDYFPFRVEVKTCATTCDPPISVGNVLYLTGSNYAPGYVQVIAATEYSFTFVALDDHIARGGVVNFSFNIRSEGTKRFVYLEVAAQAGSGGIENTAPTFFSSFVGRMTWSRMAAAMRCEYLYRGREEFRRC